MSTLRTQQQQVTPELRQWIVDQAGAGHSAESVLKAMLASGWTEDVAVEAMESTLRGHLEQRAQAQGLPPSVPVPENTIAMQSAAYASASDSSRTSADGRRKWTGGVVSSCRLPSERTSRCASGGAT